MTFTVYEVGGAVRDSLLGLPVRDRDWVVVGATPEALIAAGYLPVGRDFPVFLHPQNREEYALARTERKSGQGYHGFVFYASADVTLEQDLARRDLTINAMARDGSGRIIDPYGGQRDLAARVLRHVAPAFSEDPLRILRVARFAARFPDFSLAPETLALMQQMVAAGETDHLVAERVWQELSGALMAAQPSRFLQVLRSCGALARLLPEVDALYGVPQRPEFHPEIDTGIHLELALDAAALAACSLPARFAVLGHDLGKGTTPHDMLPRHIGHEVRSAALLTPLCARLRVPTACRDVALLVARFHGDIGRVAQLRPATVVDILERCDALRRPARFADILAACTADYQGRPHKKNAAFAPAQMWEKAQTAAQRVDAGMIAAKQQEKAQTAAQLPQAIAAAVHAARVAAVRCVLMPDANSPPES